VARRGTPLIAPALAQKAARCIKKAAAGVESLADSELALAMTIHTVVEETGLDRKDVAKVLETIAELPKHCLCEPEEDIEIETVEEPKRGRVKRKGSKKKK
jgi:hypothetical protein